MPEIMEHQSFPNHLEDEKHLVKNSDLDAVGNKSVHDENEDINLSNRLFPDRSNFVPIQDTEIEISSTNNLIEEDADIVELENSERPNDRYACDLKIVDLKEMMCEDDKVDTRDDELQIEEISVCKLQANTKVELESDEKENDFETKNNSEKSINNYRGRCKRTRRNGSFQNNDGNSYSDTDTCNDVSTDLRRKKRIEEKDECYCYICNNFYSSQYDLQRHIRRSTCRIPLKVNCDREEMWKCLECSFKTTLLSKLTLHLHAAHYHVQKHKFMCAKEYSKWKEEEIGARCMHFVKANGASYFFQCSISRNCPSKFSLYCNSDIFRVVYFSNHNHELESINIPERRTGDDILATHCSLPLHCRYVKIDENSWSILDVRSMKAVFRVERIMSICVRECLMRCFEEPCLGVCPHVLSCSCRKKNSHFSCSHLHLINHPDGELDPTQIYIEESIAPRKVAAEVPKLTDTVTSSTDRNGKRYSPSIAHENIVNSDGNKSPIPSHLENTVSPHVTPTREKTLPASNERKKTLEISYDEWQMKNNVHFMTVSTEKPVNEPFIQLRSYLSQLATIIEIPNKHNSKVLSYLTAVLKSVCIVSDNLLENPDSVSDEALQYYLDKLSGQMEKIIKPNHVTKNFMFTAPIKDDTNVLKPLYSPFNINLLCLKSLDLNIPEVEVRILKLFDANFSVGWVYDAVICNFFSRLNSNSKKLCVISNAATETILKHKVLSSKWNWKSWIEKDVLFVPCKSNNREWILLIILMAERKIYVLDPDPKVNSITIAYTKHEELIFGWCSVLKEHFDMVEWDITDLPHTKHSMPCNSSVLVCWYAYRYIHDLSLTDPVKINDVRKFIYDTVIEFPFTV